MTELTAVSGTQALTGLVFINGKPVTVEWTPRAARALEARAAPLIVELELYFSCLVKKFVHFRDDARGHATTPVTDKLAVYFRPVVSSACSWDEAQRRGRQPEIEIHTDNVKRIAPKRVRIDYKRDAWSGEYWL
jgi:hypothetical protein